ncbi:MCP four helix bundle domain-containing protein [Paenibacillus auburnensis]|nr:MCP four helix bundle domain-containing protein [Paenibacillus auburnensis]
MWVKALLRRLKLNIRMKLLSGFLIVVVLLAFISMYSLNQINTMSESAEEIDQVWVPGITLLGTLNGDISNVERLALSIIVERWEWDYGIKGGLGATHNQDR